MSRPTLVLHGGFHKTATSHIQSLLARNTKWLERNRVFYVHHRHMRKQLTVPCQFNAYTKLGMQWDPWISDEDLAQSAGAFFDDILSRDVDRVILSDENLAGHCGHCVKQGKLYHWRDLLFQAMAAQFPYPVSEVYLGVRNYADFFASAYVEYLRSVSGRKFVDETQMRKRLLANMPSWTKTVDAVHRFFPDAKVTVWRYEDFRQLDTHILSLLCGPGIDVSKLKAPKDKNKRPTASGRAVSELLQLIHHKGADFALEQRVALQEAYPRGKKYGSYDPWTKNERAHLTRVYERDVNDMRANPKISVLSVDVDEGVG